MATTQDFWNWIPGPKLTSEYLLYLFRAMRPEFERLAYGSTHRTIYEPDAASLRICVPPLEEQRAITSHIKLETAAIDTARRVAEQTIALLRERRERIVAALVAGKLGAAGPQV